MCGIYMYITCIYGYIYVYKEGTRITAEYIKRESLEVLPLGLFRLSRKGRSSLEHFKETAAAGAAPAKAL